MNIDPYAADSLIATIVSSLTEWFFFGALFNHGIRRTPGSGVANFPETMIGN